MLRGKVKKTKISQAAGNVGSTLSFHYHMGQLS